MKFLILLLSVIILKTNQVFSQKPLGALLQIDFTGNVGYLLDEIPDSLQEKSIDYIKNKVSDKQWLERAKLQIKHTLYRQVFRQNYFDDGRLQLTIPPLDVWRIEFTSLPYSASINGHKYISRDYKFSSFLVGRADSVNKSEPSLDQIGGVYSEIFIVPADPEHVFQRIGYACADESSFSLDTVNSENSWTYHDQECKGNTNYLKFKISGIIIDIIFCYTKLNHTCLLQIEHIEQIRIIVIGQLSLIEHVFKLW